MENRSGWLERSLERARANIEARPEHLKPQRYRTSKRPQEKVTPAQRKPKKS